MKQIIKSFCVAAVAAGVSASALAGNITVKGSDTLVIRIAKSDHGFVRRLAQGQAC